MDGRFQGAEAGTRAGDGVNGLDFLWFYYAWLPTLFLIDFVVLQLAIRINYRRHR